VLLSNQIYPILYFFLVLNATTLEKAQSILQMEQNSEIVRFCIWIFKKREMSIGFRSSVWFCREKYRKGIQK